MVIPRDSGHDVSGTCLVGEPPSVSELAAPSDLNPTGATPSVPTDTTPTTALPGDTAPTTPVPGDTTATSTP